MLSHQNVLFSPLWSCIWSLDSPGFSVIEIAFNKILRKIWNLPSHSHTSTVHCVANIPTICNIVHKRFFVLIRQCLSSASPLVSRIIFDSCYYAYNSIGYNFLHGDSHVCSPYSEDTLYSSKIQLIRKIFGTVSHFKDLIRFFFLFLSLSCLIFLSLCTLVVCAISIIIIIGTLKRMRTKTITMIMDNESDCCINETAIVYKRKILFSATFIA